MVAASPAIPPNPKNAAIIAIIKKVILQRSIMNTLLLCFEIVVIELLDHLHRIGRKKFQAGPLIFLFQSSIALFAPATFLHVDTASSALSMTVNPNYRCHRSAVPAAAWF